MAKDTCHCGQPKDIRSMECNYCKKNHRNIITVIGDQAYIQLQGNQQAVIDAEDVPLVENRFWRVNTTNIDYHRVVSPVGTIYLHHVIMGKNGHGFVVDHKDGNALNNKRSNLRVCLQPENMQNQKLRRTNQSGYKGVSRYASGWRARIRGILLGCFHNPEEAAHCYDAAAIKLFGEFARVNFPFEGAT